MRFTAALIVTLLICSCSFWVSKISPWSEFAVKQYGIKDLKNIRLNFRNGTELAKAQDSLFDVYRKNEHISKNTVDSLAKNIWVQAASKLAPGNLVIRQWCLIDLFKDTCLHKRPIKSSIKYLTYDEDSVSLWAEGYSYWLYTKSFLQEWSDVFAIEGIKKKISQIDRGFLRTSYKRDGNWYPAPLGDLRDEPLEESLQYDHLCQSRLGILRFDCNTKTYKILGDPIGLNPHIPADTFEVKIIMGYPKNFDFYKGYDKKYKSKKEEWADILKPNRINSLDKIRF